MWILEHLGGRLQIPWRLGFLWGAEGGDEQAQRPERGGQQPSSIDIKKCLKSVEAGDECSHWCRDPRCALEQACNHTRPCPGGIPSKWHCDGNDDIDDFFFTHRWSSVIVFVETVGRRLVLLETFVNIWHKTNTGWSNWPSLVKSIIVYTATVRVMRDWWANSAIWRERWGRNTPFENCLLLYMPHITTTLWKMLFYRVHCIANVSFVVMWSEWQHLNPQNALFLLLLCHQNVQG